MISPAYYLVGQVGHATLPLTGPGACFVVGTRIATPLGDDLAERIAPGDVILTACGRRRAVRWVGQCGYSGRFLAVTPRLRPIRFTAGSLGGALPDRDLLVSPEQSMFVEGVLIPAFLLVNGTTIVVESALARVDYVFIETDRPDLLLAEGAAAETFIADGRPGLQDDARLAAAPGGAARLEDGYALEAIRCRLAALAP